MTKTKVVHTVSGLYSSYSKQPTDRINGEFISLPNYQQEDNYSCGFVAALTVIHYFHPLTDPPKVLTAVGTRPYGGTSLEGITNGLRKMKVRTLYRDDLTIFDLYQCVKLKIPVIISVWPYYYSYDHWTVVQGFDGHKVYLTNHYSMMLGDFLYEWIDSWEDGSVTGCGLICLNAKGV